MCFKSFLIKTFDVSQGQCIYLFVSYICVLFGVININICNQKEGDVMINVLLFF